VSRQDWFCLKCRHFKNQSCVCVGSAFERRLRRGGEPIGFLCLPELKGPDECEPS
jgi:hypothetical protein